MNKKCTPLCTILLAFFLLAFSGCGSSGLPEAINLPACFPFVCQPTPAAPSVSTDAATNITTNSADLNGHINPNWKDTNGWFEWSTLATMSSYSTNNPGQLIVAGNATLTISYAVSGLTGSTTYYYRAAAYNTLGPSKGNIVSFTTL